MKLDGAWLMRGFHWTVAVMIAMIPHALTAGVPPRPGYSKVLIGKQLFAQPDASSAPQLLTGLDGSVIEEYEGSSLVALNSSHLSALLARGRMSQVEITPRDDFDHLYVGGRKLDTRLGTGRSFPSRSLDTPYRDGEFGTWLLQFIGPIKPEWIERLRSAGVVFVQYLPYNAWIAATQPETIRVIAELPFVQFADQFHASLRPAVHAAAEEKQVLLWVQIADAPGSDQVLELLNRLSVGGAEAARWSEAELRVEGSFRSEDLEIIVREPLVIAVTRRPTIALSDERVNLSLTSLPPGTNGGRYKKWLSDLCEACANLQGYFIGIADTGIDGGFHAQAGTIPGEPESTDQHRVELPKSRLVKGRTFEAETGTSWPLPGPTYPDSTGSLHDVRGHGTLVAAIAAGDPTVPGPAPAEASDNSNFYRGMGVAPTAGLLITKINEFRVATSATPLRLVVGDARLHISNRAYIQNHSYNQYTKQQSGECDVYYDGYYTILSRDFDRYSRDVDDSTPVREESLLTVSAGNEDHLQQGYPRQDCGWERHGLTLPPATAKNVLAVGMAEGFRASSNEWNCWGSLSESFNNIAGESKTGTATAGWFKPDLMAPAANVTSSRSYDLESPPVNDNYCQNGASNPPLPSSYLASSGTSFAAPAAAGAALLASRYYAARVGGDSSSASPALLKAMLIAGARSMRGGIDRGAVRAWRPYTPVVYQELIIPRIPNGHVYRLRSSGTTTGTEPQWPVSGIVSESNGLSYERWQSESDRLITGLPNDRQGFGRLHLSDVLSSYPARDLLSSVAAPAVSIPWTRVYRVHDGEQEVRVVIAWSDVPADVQVNPEDPPFITGPPLVNDLDLSVETGSPCGLRYLGNDMTDDLSDPDLTCSITSFDRKNNVEIIRFRAPAGTLFTVKVARASTSGTGEQDFALVTYNAYVDGTTAPPGPPQNVRADATSTSSVRVQWDLVPGATSYDIQRTLNIDTPFVTIRGGETGISFDDAGLQGNTTYIYRVRSRSTASPSVLGVSAPDVATTIVFPDDPIVASATPIRASHIDTLRLAASKVREAARLPAYNWSDPQIGQTTPVRATHITELRASIDQALVEIGIPSTQYTDPSLIPLVTTVRAAHVNELRERVK